MESTITDHKHTGTDSSKISILDLDVNKGTLTTKNVSSLSSGGANSLTNADNTILENMRTRINDLETILRSINLLN